MDFETAARIHMKSDSSLSMDIQYSRAFIGAAIEAGKAKVVDEWQDLAAAKDINFSKFLVAYRSTNKLKTTALEMALIFNKVHLFGVPSGIDLRGLERDQIVGSVMTEGQRLEGAEVPIEFTQFAKPWLIRPIFSEVKRFCRNLQGPLISYRMVSYAYDLLGVSCRAGVDLWQVKVKLVNPETDERPEYGRVGDVLLESMSEAGAVDDASSLVCLALVAQQLITHWNIFLFSCESRPFLTNSLKYLPQTTMSSRVALRRNFKFDPENPR